MAKCPECQYCLSLKGASIGMYHCNFCGEMILAGMDPAPHCIYRKRLHGKRGTYVNQKCRCKVCREANCVYQTRYYHKIRKLREAGVKNG